GDALVRRRAATLGDTLAGLPGVQSSGFGPGVGRPVIRGLDGPRVRVLSDGADLLHASVSSPDHASTGGPQLLERIEVLKGPATLMYGGGAIGGVVNLIDRRVHLPARGRVGGGSGAAWQYRGRRESRCLRPDGRGGAASAAAGGQPSGGRRV